MSEAPRLPAFSPIWTDPDDIWPLDRRDAVFFGRALNQIGPLIAPGWEGIEFGLVRYAPPPSAGGGGGLDIHVLIARAEALSRADPGFAAVAQDLATRDKLARILGADPRATGTVDSPSAAERLALKTRAEAAAKLIHAAESPYIERAKAVRRRVVQALIDDDLRASFRWDGDGELHPCPAAWWNVEPGWLDSRFAICKVDWRNPTRAGKGTPDFAWLYLDAERLTAFRATVEAPEAAWRPGDGDTLSHWGRDGGDAEAAARARLKARHNPAPLEARICEELAAMWNLARPEDKPTNGGSVAELRRRGRT